MSNRTVKTIVRTQPKKSIKARRAKRAHQAKVVVVRQQRRTANPRRRPQKRANRGTLNRGIEGVNMLAPEICNRRTHTPPRIEEGFELVATVLGSVAFATTQFNINPGNATTFPVLSAIARLYERYEFEQLSFHYGHDVSGFAAQGQTGLVYQSALYDAASAAPTTVNQIEATDPFVVCMPNENSCLRLDKKSMHPSNEPKFVLAGNPPGATDIKTYNAGSLFISSSGLANASECGKLRVKYKVRLFDRILDATAVSAPANFSVSSFQTAGTATEPIVTATGLTLAMAVPVVNGLGAVNVAGSILLPAGNYLIDSVAFLFATAVTNFTVGVRKNGVLVGVSSLQTYTAGDAVTSAVMAINPAFFTSNGADLLTLVVSANTTFTGVGLAGGSIRITAV